MKNTIFVAGAIPRISTAAGIITAADVGKVFSDVELVHRADEFESRITELEAEVSTLKVDMGRLMRNANVESLHDLELLLKGE